MDPVSLWITGQVTCARSPRLLCVVFLVLLHHFQESGQLFGCGCDVPCIVDAVQILSNRAAHPCAPSRYTVLPVHKKNSGFTRSLNL